METKEILEAVENKFNEVSTKAATKEEVKDVVKELNDVKEQLATKEDLSKISDMQTRLSEKLEMMKEQKENEFISNKEGFKKALKSAYEGMIDKFKNPEFKDATLTIKALPLTTGTWTGSTNYPFLQDDQEAGVANEPRSPQTFRNDIPTGSQMTSDTWTWLERGTIVDGTVTRAENETFGVVEVAYHKVETKVKKIANYTKVTREMLEDWNEFLEAVNDLIETLNNEKLNTQLFNGDGQGSNILGVVPQAVEFDANGITETNANIYDSIKVAITQVMISGKTNWMVNKIYMNPSDVTASEIKKDTTGNYIFPPFVMPNGMTVDGITITKTTDIPQGYFLVADMNRSRKRFKRDLELRIYEQNEDDAINDLLTITGSMRVAFRIKDLDKPAFVYDSFDTAISIIKGSAAALAAILNMAQDGIADASKLTINQLELAGVTGTVAADLADYKVAVAAAASIADLAALQTVIDNA